ncbi:MAG TPA: hypothetical protein VFM21_03640, partial [Terriglobia bacterium]|nr:hypothetical protein [Terriglobia bacterium]
ILVFGPALPAPAQQDQPEPQQQQQPQPGPAQKEEKRPTLGPPTPPTPGMVPVGPATDFVLDAAKLMRVRKVYVEAIDNHLSDKLMDGLSKSGRFQVVADKKDADAIIRGTCFDARHLRSVHTEIFMSDRLTGKSIWQDTVRVPYSPPPLAKAVDATADRILLHLANSVAKSQPH